MEEIKRILFHKKFLVGILLVICFQIFTFVIQEQERTNGDISFYQSTFQQTYEELSVHSLPEKQQLIATKKEEAMLFQQAILLYHMKDSPFYPELLEEYKKQYPTIDDYVTSIANDTHLMEQKKMEYQVLLEWEQQLSYLLGYKDYLIQIEQRANTYQNLPIFSNENSFSYKNILKTKQDFEAVKNIELSIGQNRFVLSIINDNSSSIFFILLMVIVSIVLLEAKTNGLEPLIFGTKNGRWTITCYRFFALFLCSILVVLSTYGVKIICSYVFYGNLLEWNRYIQSIPEFQPFPMPLTTYQFLLWYLILQVFIAFILGLVLWSIFHWSQSISIGIGLSCVVMAIEYGLFATIKGNSILSIFRTINLVTLLSLKTVFFRYVNLNIFQVPIGEWHIILFTIALLFFLFLAINSYLNCVCYPFGRNKILSFLDKYIVKPLCRNKLVLGTNLYSMEFYKILVSQKGLWIFIILFIWVLPNMSLPTNEMDNYEYLAEKLYTSYEGVDRTIIKNELLLKQEREQIQYKELQKYSNSLHSNYDMEDSLRGLEANMQATQLLLSDLNRLEQLPSHLKLELVNPYPYHVIFGEIGMNDNTKLYTMEFVILILLLSSTICYEYKTNMKPSLFLTPKGRYHLWKVKRNVVFLLTFLLWTLFTITQIFLFYNKYGVPTSLSASVYSLEVLQHSIFSYSIQSALLIRGVSHLLLAFVVASIVIFSSTLCQGAIGSMVLSLGIVFLPTAFSLFGISFFDHFNLIFQVKYAGIWTNYVSFGIFLLYCLLAIIGLIISYYYWNYKEQPKNRLLSILKQWRGLWN